MKGVIRKVDTAFISNSAIAYFPNISASVIRFQGSSFKRLLNGRESLNDRTYIYKSRWTTAYCSLVMSDLYKSELGFIDDYYRCTADESNLGIPKKPYKE